MAAKRVRNTGLAQKLLDWAFRKDVSIKPGWSPGARNKGQQKRAAQRNASKTHRKAPRQTNPCRKRNPDTGTLAAARRLSQKFHGTPTEVIELSERERKLPKYVTALGEMPELAYKPRRGSKRGGVTWEHKSGDIPFAPDAKTKPVLAADPVTGKPLIVPMRSKMRMTRFGLLG